MEGRAAPAQPLLMSAGGRDGTESGLPLTLSSHDGLTTQEAELRLHQDGPNELAKNEVNQCIKFLRYFWGPMPIMIWIAILVELAEAFTDEQHWLDFGVLLLLQIVNGLVGWYEERNAGNAIAALQKELALKAFVKRDGAWVELPARCLVRGDVVHLGIGCVVPADCDLLPDVSGLPIQVDQSSLNGESLPKTVHAGGRVFQGTIVKRGEIDGIVVDTGARTFFGRASQLVASAEQAKGSGGHFQRLVTTLTLALLFLSLFLVSILSVKLLMNKESVLKVISIAVVLLVASIPIAMQVVCTSTMAVGAHKLAMSKALVCKLTAIEELAAMNVLCSDKTGTLTMNQLSVRPPVFVLEQRCTAEELLFFAALAARRGGAEQDAIDHCICADVQHRGQAQALEAFTTLHFVPFDPVTKRTEAIVEGPAELPASTKGEPAPIPPHWRGKPVMVVKGAPQVVLALSHDAERIQEVVSESVSSFASRGFRAIGVARALPAGASSSNAAPNAGGQPSWEFLGLVPLFDPPRHDTRKTIEKARQLGIEVKMITGDQTAIAKETARSLGMGTNIHRADALIVPEGAAENSPQAEQVAELVESCNGFAEVFPEHKFKIVQTLQKRGHRVGMTGDGVNDAPALKAGDVGIAVKGSSDAARAAADIVLTCDGLAVIIEAIARARMIFERMRNYCIYRIACTTNLLFFFFFAMMFINPNTISRAPGLNHEYFDLPVLCLVLITLLNDGCILTIAYDHVQPSASPSCWNLREVVILAVTMGFMSCFASILMLLAGLNVLTDDTSFFRDVWGGKLNLDPLHYPQLQTMLYLDVSLLGFLTIFAARTRGLFWSRRPAMPLLIAGLFALAASTAFARTDFVKAVTGATESSVLPWPVVGLVWAYCLVWFLAEDSTKALLIRYMERGVDAEDAEPRPVFTSSFWRVTRSADLRNTLSVGGGARSLLTSVQHQATGAGQQAVVARQLAQDIEQHMGASGVAGTTTHSLLSRGSIISASLTADPIAVAAAGDRTGSVTGSLATSLAAASSSVVKDKEGRPSAATASTSPGSNRPSNVSLWSQRTSDAAMAIATSSALAHTAEAAVVLAAEEATKQPSPADQI